MARGKNYVNNNKGVFLQGNAKSKANMRICEYGAGCTRPDCIYRHEVGDKKDEVCLPFLADKCTFKNSGCRKRHPTKEEKARLIIKYKRTRCRFGDECFTEGCLYLHPREIEVKEPSYIEPNNVAFPPLNGVMPAAAPKPVPNSAWKAAPLVAKKAYPEQVQSPFLPPALTQVEEQQPYPVPMMQMPQQQIEGGPPHGWQAPEMPFYPPYYPSPQYYDPSMGVPHQGNPPMPYYGAPMSPHPMPYAVPFNADAKEFVPGNPTA